MAKNIICYICDQNLAYQAYEGKLVSEDGDKPCSECVLESNSLEDINEEDCNE